MNKHYLVIIAAMTLLTPFAVYSSSTTKVKDHTPIDRSQTDTYYDGMRMDQPMKDMKDMKSDKMMDDSKTGVKLKKKSGKTKIGAKSQKQGSKPMQDMTSDKTIGEPVTEVKSGEITDKPVVDIQPGKMEGTNNALR